MSKIEAVRKAAQFGLGRGVLLAKKHAPTVMTVGGVVGLIGAGVLASRATLKLEPVIDRIQDGVSDVKDLAELGTHDGSGEYTKKDYTKDMAHVYIRGAKELAVLYGPAVTLAVASAASIIGAHGIMQKRNAALAAAYKAVEYSFDQYRKRVAEELGEEKEREIKLGVTTTEETDEETGKKVSVDHVDPNGLSQYAKIFGETNPEWQKAPGYNLMFLKARQNYANDILHARGHLFLNEVYEMLQIPHTKAGAVVGWVRGKDGDNFVDFGIYEMRNQEAVNHTTSRADGSFILDFNVDGVIYDLLD